MSHTHTHTHTSSSANGLISGQWATEGCTRNDRASNKSQTVCECNHLTHFALLLSTTKISVSGALECQCQLDAILHSLPPSLPSWPQLRHSLWGSLGLSVSPSPSSASLPPSSPTSSSSESNSNIHWYTEVISMSCYCDPQHPQLYPRPSLSHFPSTFRLLFSHTSHPQPSHSHPPLPPQAPMEHEELYPRQPLCLTLCSTADIHCGCGAS